MGKVLVADDEKVIRQILKDELNNIGFEVVLAKDGIEASIYLENDKFDIVILDIKMPGKDGLQVLREIRSRDDDSIVIFITAFGSIDNAVYAMKIGANDYITKPFDNNEFMNKINQLVKIKHNMPKIKKQNQEEFIIGDNIIMKQIKEKIDKVKDLNTTILITGESGTGKGMIAKEIHRLSNRCNLPFVHVDCAFLPSNLVESELFGYEKGAFTGATSSKKGKFELAENGTIFLDEIGILPLNLQSKLLNVLQEKSIDKVGGTKKVPMEARVIAATNENLENCVTNKTFREDLYYRLNVVSIEAPPLRYRKDDIIMLTDKFIEKHMVSMGKEISHIEEDFYNVVKDYDWPGNVRELENAVESAIALCDDNVLKADDWPIRIRSININSHSLNSESYDLSLKQKEILAIIEALEKNNGHREKTANDLGISRRTLQYKLKKLNIV